MSYDYVQLYHLYELKLLHVCKIKGISLSEGRIMNSKKYYTVLSLVLLLGYSYVNAFVVLINGTCSAGKTTISHKLIDLMNADYKPVYYISVDAIAREIAQINNSSMESSDTESQFYKQAIQQAIIEAKRQHEEGKIVIVDVVLFNNEEVMKFKNEIGEIFVKHVLIYADLQTLFLNVTQRNDGVDELEKRSLFLPFQQYLHFYTYLQEELTEGECARFIQLKLSDIKIICEKIYTRILPQSKNSGVDEKALVDILSSRFCENFYFSVRNLSCENLLRGVRVVEKDNNSLNERVIVRARIAFDKMFENLKAHDCALQIQAFIKRFQTFNFYA